MDRTTPLTREEIALEILKLSAQPLDKDNSMSLRSEIEDNAKKIVKAYTTILDTLYSYQPKS